MDVSQLHFFLFLASPPVRCWCNYGHLLGRKLSGGPKEVLPRHITPCCLRRSFVPPLSFCLVHFCCFAFVAGFCFLVLTPFSAQSRTGQLRVFAPRTSLAPEARRGRRTSPVLCVPAGPALRKIVASVSIHAFVLAFAPPILTSRFMPCHFLSASGIAFLFLFRELVSPSIELAGRPFKYLLRLMGRSDMDCDDCMSGPFLGVVLTPF